MVEVKKIKDLWNRPYFCTECEGTDGFGRKHFTEFHEIGINFGLCTECNEKWNEKLNG